MRGFYIPSEEFEDTLKNGRDLMALP